MSIIDAQIVRKKPEEAQIGKSSDKVEKKPEEEEQETTVNIIKRVFPNAGMVVSEYRTWLLSELKTIAAMRDTDKIVFGGNLHET